MEISIICENLMKAINQEKIIIGKVHSVFSNACNIEAGSYFITLLSSSKIISPMSAIISAKKTINFKELGIEQNMSFKFTSEGIYCLEKDIYISLGAPMPWCPNIINKCNDMYTGYLEGNLNKLEAGLMTYGKLQGMGQLMTFLDNDKREMKLYRLWLNNVEDNFYYIKNEFICFMESVIKVDMTQIAVKASKIIGFGIGLTPCVDDFISGLMTINVCMGKQYGVPITKIYGFNTELISLSTSRTTRVSCEMLKHSSLGRTNSAVMNLIQAVLSENTEKNDNMEKFLKDAVNYGETSGTDTILGIYVGLKMWANSNYRRAWLNDTVC